jgi:hypothetical protein
MLDLLAKMVILLLIGLGSLNSPAAFAADPTNVNITLEGCRNDGTIKLPNPSGNFVCPDSAYTSGNLGKGWSELDLVPYKITLQAGNAAPASQTYTIAYVVDNEDAGKPGYDVLSSLVLRSGACTAAVNGQSIASPGLGGISKSMYRTATITQPKGETCVYDFYARLALGSHLFPGSSLHANMALPTTSGGITISGIGAKDVSIPVKQLEPQGLRKDMTASQEGEQTWNLTKSASSNDVSFGNVCAADAPVSKPLSIEVKWSIAGVVAGKTVAIANIYAKNPASRDITVNVTDVIYKGTTQTSVLDSQTFPSFTVPANTEKLVATHTKYFDSGVAGNLGDYLNDVATATYVDLATNIPVPGQTTAQATAEIKPGQIINTAADISDLESITGSGLTFSVATPSIGSFSGYTAGEKALSVLWNSGSQSTGGSITFNKMIYLDAKQVTSGILTDTAKLTSGTFSKSTDPVNVNVSSSASVALRIQKDIPSGYVGTGAKLEVTFHISSLGDPAYSVDKTLTFNAGDTSKYVDITGLAPNDYTVKETTVTYFPAGGGASFTPIGLAPDDGQVQRTVNLGIVDGKVPNCSGTAYFKNVQGPASYAKAQVEKITDPALASGDPDYNWTFTLSGPGVNATTSANAGAGAVVFKDSNGNPLLLMSAGTYTVTETERSGWILNSASPNDTVNTKVCSFTVKYPEDASKTLGCSFKNTKTGKAKVVKTASGAVPTGTQAFLFQLRRDATSTTNGTILETQTANAANGGLINFSTFLVPGTTYQICEVVQAGWLSTLGTFVPGSFMPPDGNVPNPSVDNSILCGNFVVAAGETKSFTVDNSPPPGGRALTIGYWKNWASCTASATKINKLDIALFGILPSGIQVGAVKSLVNPAGSSSLYGQKETSTADCPLAVSLLNKTDFTGAKRASDPLFNMAAQLVAASLNQAAGAYRCGSVLTAINSANDLLSKYKFNGYSYSPKLTSPDASLANSLAQKLDDYNNDRPGVCP